MVKKIATLAIAIAAQTAELKQGFQDVQREIKTLGDGMSGAFTQAQVAATVLLETLEAVRDAVEGMFNMFMGSVEIAQFAESLGLSREEAEAYVLAMRQMGVSQEQAIDLMKEFNVKLGEAREGTGEGAEALERLGISLEDLQRNSPIENFRQVSEAIRDMEADMARFTAGQAFAGIGEDFLPEIQRFSGELEMARGHIEAIGLVDLNMEGVRDIQRMWAQIAFDVRQIVTDIGTDLIPAVKTLAEFTKEIADDWQRISNLITNTFRVSPIGQIIGASGRLIQATDVPIRQTQQAPVAPNAAELATARNTGIIADKTKTDRTNRLY